jgi:hypothetical protein
VRGYVDVAVTGRILNRKIRSIACLQICFGLIIVGAIVQLLRLFYPLLPLPSVPLLAPNGRDFDTAHLRLQLSIDGL